jgi:membrane-associated phospholipid phosphatase
MDRALLNFFNQTLAHPILDWPMLGAIFGGLILLPVIGIMLWRLQQRRSALTVFVAMALALFATFAFQFAAQRPRPDHVRLITPPPSYPSYLSGHAALAFSVATVLCLTYRHSHWIWLTLGGAGLVSISRIYLGMHYPSFGG